MLSARLPLQHALHRRVRLLGHREGRQRGKAGWSSKGSGQWKGEHEEHDEAVCRRVLLAVLGVASLKKGGTGRGGGGCALDEELELEVDG